MTDEPLVEIRTICEHVGSEKMEEALAEMAMLFKPGFFTMSIIDSGGMGIGPQYNIVMVGEKA